jgi:hypothetical protein
VELRRGEPPDDGIDLVAAGDGGEAVGAFNASAVEDAPVAAITVDALPTELRAEPVEHGRIGIDDRDAVTAQRQRGGQPAADATAADDDDVHDAFFP